MKSSVVDVCSILTAMLLGALALPRSVDAGLVPLAATGQPAPGGGTFGTNFGVPVINAAGQVAFSVQTNPSFPTATDVGVYQGTLASNLAAVARIGGDLTSVGRGVAENASGTVVFNANAGAAIIGHNADAPSSFFVASTGDVFQPVGGGGPMYTLTSFGDPLINDNGQIAYLASGGATVLFDDSVFVAYSGQGDTLNGKLVGFDGPIAIDNDADAAFFATVDTTTGTKFAIATSNTANSMISFSVFSGDDVGGRTFGYDTSSIILGPAGIAFLGSLCANGTCEGDVFLLQGSSTLQVIAKTGDPAPGGGTFAAYGSVPFVFDAPHMNDDGSIVFVGSTDGGPGQGVYRYTQAHGLEAMALQGQAPYAAAAGFRNAVINDHDVVAFQAFDGLGQNHRGVYLTDGTTTIRAGDDKFFGAEGSSTGAFSRAFFGSQIEGQGYLNDRNQVTFVGSIINSHGSTIQSVLKFTVDPVWLSPTSGTWDTPANWTFATEPVSDSNVRITGQAAGPLLVTGPAAATTVGTLFLGNGPNAVELDLQNGGPLTATTELDVLPPGVLGGKGTLTTAALEIGPGGRMTGQLTLDAASIYNAGTIDGDFTFNGDVINDVTGSILGDQKFNGNVTNLGTISPGHSPGTDSVTGDLTLQATTDQGVLTGSVLEIQIGGPNPGTDYDVIDVTGALTLAGTLHVTFINGFTPAPGQTFHVLNAGSVSGSFDAVTGAVVTSQQGGLDIGPPSETTSTPKALIKCAATIAKAGSGFGAARLKALDGCVGAVFKCVQLADGDAKQLACFIKANAACSKDLVKITGLETKLTGAIDKGCGPVGAADVLAAVGVGYQDVAAECAGQFGTTLGTLASVEQCVLRAHACHGDAILDAQAPRAKELMRVAEVASPDLDALTCLPDHQGTGAGLGTPKGAGKAVTSCAATLMKAGNTLVAKEVKSLAGCIAPIFSCVTANPGDAACLAKAHATCDKAFAAIAAATTALDGAFAKACTPPAVAFTDLTDPAGANLATLADDCAAVGVASLATPADYETCLARRATCDAEALVRFEAPRADLLLGLVGRSLSSPFCPAG